ncbi:class I SAM-dependent methyltransferase [Chondrinema litorale]|uniref:class I SAM-dependent methyltransferase n=1 Tax=Chondrinema litorale TaxID=2994555 RepID=UPI0025438BE2|nr:class I SAM-dependent methyltransferase [Chondrinema litorale]UZR99504.1 class I SAM-dependent methyltransferase [Chondrinema litorale]
MSTVEKEVNWKSYAQKYDMLLSYNPYYQQLYNEVLSYTNNWDTFPNDILLDIGAGTGNYSTQLALQHPQANIIHIDNDKGMNLEAANKANFLGLKNHIITDKNIREVVFAHNSVKGIISIHALYTFPNPTEIIKRIYNWLVPNGKVVLVDAGRIVNVISWQIAIGYHLLKNYGLKKTLSIMEEGKEVSKQNSVIRQMQKSGKFWMHSHKEFCSAIEDAGFIIENAHKTFRNVSDFVVARK